MARVKFVPPPSSTFKNVLTSRVDAYFSERGISKHADWRMWAKVLFYVGGYLGAYAVLVLVPLSMPAYFALMVLLGLLTAGIGFNVGHDAAHRGLSSRAWVNDLVAHSFTLIGAHTYTWKILHNVIHHTYTNIPGADGDLNTVPAIRFFESDTPRRPYHRFQHIYIFGLYSLASLVWVFQKDYQHMRKKEHCGYKKPVPPMHEWVTLYACKALHYSLFLVIPWLVVGLPVWQMLVGFLCMHLVSGLSLATVFSVGHMVDDAAIVYPDEQHQVHDEWSAHQLRTTANFATKSWFFWWTVGGLNFQVEHHLFPTICHVHYKALAPIVEQTAKEFGIPYYSYESFPKALAAHIRHLRRYGQAEPVPAGQVSVAQA